MRRKGYYGKEKGTLEGFINWFLKFIKALVGGILEMVSGIADIFNIPSHINTLVSEGEDFGIFEWLAASLIMVFIFAFIVVMVVLWIRREISNAKIRRAVGGSEDVAEELEELRREVARLSAEKEEVLSMKITAGTMSEETLTGIFRAAAMDEDPLTEDELNVGAPEDEKGKDERFSRLKAVDEYYYYYNAPEYDNGMGLSKICDTFRNFACSSLKLYYDIKVVRLMIAGLASTRLIMLQGISGTGKTSLPYAIGKFLKNDATIASVQPTWRERTELFGFFNEFTKKFNETEVLRRIYEASYNDDIHMVILDEMNISRIEYYFADMLSILEMPDPSEWKVELVPSAWDTDPEHMVDGKITIPQNVWYVGTANNDDSTYAVSDKVYDRAIILNLDTKGVPFDAPDTPPVRISYSHLASLFERAIRENPVSERLVSKIMELDAYVVENFRVAFGNRIMKQLYSFVPVYVACGGKDVDAVDYLLATKVIRKFESLNLAMFREEIGKLVDYINELFGDGQMEECIRALRRLERLY